MNGTRRSTWMLGALYTAFVLSLIWSASILPLRVATHFNLAGQPDGWLSRSEHLACMFAFGSGFPAFLIGICWSIRFLPAGLINIPHREFWLAPARRAESNAFVFRHSIVLANLALGFVIGLHWIVVWSNQRQPAQLPLLWGCLVSGLFLVAVGGWILILGRRFRLPDTARLLSC